MRAVAGLSAVLGFAAGLAFLLWHVHPVLALIPLVVPGLPAGLMFAATIRHGSPYDVGYLYPSGGVGSVGPHD